MFSSYRVEVNDVLVFELNILAYIFALLSKRNIQNFVVTCYLNIVVTNVQKWLKSIQIFQTLHDIW